MPFKLISRKAPAFCPYCGGVLDVVYLMHKDRWHCDWCNEYLFTAVFKNKDYDADKELNMNKRGDAWVFLNRMRMKCKCLNPGWNKNRKVHGHA